MAKIIKIEDIPGYKGYRGNKPNELNPFQIQHEKTMKAIQEYRDIAQYMRDNLYTKKDAD